MIFELLKNSLRAVVERFGTDYEDDYPPIKLVIAHGKEVSDFFIEKKKVIKA
jgi:pyruvate dehydrogenase kinase 2/3/4